MFKNFVVWEQRYLQFRWEMFNALNQVNLANPAVILGVATAGEITATSANPRNMQLALKFVF